MIGRPSKLTPAVQEAIVEGVRLGMSLSSAAERVGVAAATANDWMRRGEGRHRQKPPTPSFVAFAAAVKRAEAELEATMLERVHAAALSGQPQTWQAAMTLLERRFPDRYGRFDRTRHEHVVSVDEATEAFRSLIGTAIQFIAPERRSEFLDAITSAETAYDEPLELEAGEADDDESSDVEATTP